MNWLKSFAQGWWWSDPRWWGATVSKVLRSAAQGLLYAILADQIGWLDRWYEMAGTVATWAMLAFLTAIVLPENTVNPSGK